MDEGNHRPARSVSLLLVAVFVVGFATVVNRHDAIVDRARECERERGQLPNYVAVNFYGIGDLMGAVATLNGVD